MSFFSDAIKSGLGLIMEAAGQQIRYYRGDAFVTITAVPGDGQRQGQQQEVVRINSQRDWMIMVDDLDFGNGPVRPQRGDRIVFGSVTAEVLPQDGDDVYRMAGFDQYRVHSKVIGT